MQTHAAAVKQHIHQLIAQKNGWLRFDDYMQAALYAPGLGYYVAGKRKFGPDGDFITAPEMGELFGRCVARQAEQVLATCQDGGDILELGAGSGALACTILNELQSMQALPGKYLILELSPDLRACQQAALEQAGLLQHVEWLEALPEAGFSGLILANEVLDAIPVRRFFSRNTQTKHSQKECAIDELGVGLDGDELVLLAKPADEQLSATIMGRKAGLDWPPDYCSEINLQAEAWVQSLAECLSNGVMLLFDYGFPRHEMYHSDRSEGTLMCHYRHQSHSDALALPGLQDITAHVDFTGIADAAIAAGMQLAGFNHQAGFLMNMGLLDILLADAEQMQAEGLDSTQAMQQQMRLSQEVKKLTLPHEMGELFKVIALSKNWGDMMPDKAPDQLPLRGFSHNDQSHRLWTQFKSSF